MKKRGKFDYIFLETTGLADPGKFDYFLSNDFFGGVMNVVLSMTNIFAKMC